MSQVAIHKPAPLILKRTFLVALVISVILASLLGVSAVLFGGFGWLEFRVVLTAVVVSLSSLCGLSCGAALAVEGREKRIVPWAGVILTTVAGAMFIVGAWSEIDMGLYWQIAATSAVFAIACAHLSLLSLARLAPSFQWSLVAAHVVILGVAAMIALIIFSGLQMNFMFRWLAVAGIVDAAISILIPIFQKLSRPEIASSDYDPPDGNHAAIDAEIGRLEKQIAEFRRMKGE
jgi:hypothetical protein